TLIGDPPNILIGSAFGKDFGDFAVNVGPAAAASLIAYLAFARWLFRAGLRAAPLSREEIARLVQAEGRIEDVPLMRKSLVIMAATVVGFIVARPPGLEGATVALSGAVALMIVGRQDIHALL